MKVCSTVKIIVSAERSPRKRNQAIMDTKTPTTTRGRQRQEKQSKGKWPERKVKSPYKETTSESSKEKTKQRRKTCGEKTKQQRKQTTGQGSQAENNWWYAQIHNYNEYSQQDTCI